MYSYQALVHQALSVVVDPSVVQPIRILSDRETPCLVMRPTHEGEAERMSRGGTRIGVEFESEEGDLLRAMNEAVVLVEDFLAAVSLVTGTPFLSTTPLQIARKDAGSQLEFLRFLPFEGLSWSKSLDASALENAAHLELHWREMDSGHRLRRAGRRYRRVLASGDPVDGFQDAFAGLEALEKPLAIEMGIPPGSETIEATCESCGASYEYKRSALAGVRAFITGVIHADESESRAQDWRLLTRLRNDLVHGLADMEDLTPRAQDLLATVSHYLHDASVHLGHLHELETDQFTIARFSKRFVFRGKANLDGLPELSEQRLLLDAEQVRWIDHGDYGIIPEFEMANHAGGAVEARSFTLAESLSSATEGDLVPAPGLIEDESATE